MWPGMAVFSEFGHGISLISVCVGRGMCIHTIYMEFYCVFPEPDPEILTQSKFPITDCFKVTLL